jgi:hypothetical protein
MRHSCSVDIFRRLDFRATTLYFPYDLMEQTSMGAKPYCGTILGALYEVVSWHGSFGSHASE